MTVEPSDIEDTSGWLGCPTELETITHYKLMLENEVQELTLQLRKAREDVFGLVQMHADVARERDQLRADLRRLNSEYAELSSKAYSLQRIADQRDHMLRENQRLLKELRERK
ncbi:hypothetical protein BK666_02255 [Pseudomonas frederiksbergensis]|uniref:Uncharacterized protein n=1 Tax=Pseudomonas frederiksbergensis TaxID=104087 RepID=A0A423KIG6_9PSED|nr:hypothetical protein [Pseudomonas frederiksbergensis]RON52941.1 hypothetical protein BK666_02255 [Pseudomonas frederiksbergensis]